MSDDSAFPTSPTAPYLPEHIVGGANRYIQNGVEPGGFLQAIIKNDLKDAVGRADHINARYITNIVSWFHNYAPGNCWGSEEKYQTWLESFAELAKPEAGG